MNEKFVRDRNCLVVYRDTPERIIQEDMLHCFAEMYARPLYLIREAPEESCRELTKGEVRQVLMKNPRDMSVWLRDDAGVFVLVSEGPDAASKDFLMDFYQSEVLKRITALTSMLQCIGVKSYEVHANEEIADSGTCEDVKSGSVKASGTIAGVGVAANAAAQEARSFSQKINRGFKFLQSAHRDVDHINVAAIERQIADKGLVGVHILETLLQSIRDGESNWSSLEVEESLAADVCTSAMSKLDAAAQVSICFNVINGEGSAERRLNVETSKRTMQSLTIHVSNR